MITECPVFDALRRPSSVATSSAASTSGSDPHPSTALSEETGSVLQGDCEHFPNVQEQIQGERDVSPHVDFMDKLIGNFKRRFDSFSLGQQLLLLIQNPFLITDDEDFQRRVRNGSDRKGAVGRERFAQLSSEVAFPLPTVPLVVGRMSIAAAAT
ncbi:unnamed protein product [Boreogadus saida]